jgi:hypothetical protein
MYILHYTGATLAMHWRDAGDVGRMGTVMNVRMSACLSSCLSKTMGSNDPAKYMHLPSILVLANRLSDQPAVAMNVKNYTSTNSHSQQSTTTTCRLGEATDGCAEPPRHNIL